MKASSVSLLLGWFVALWSGLTVSAGLFVLLLSGLTDSAVIQHRNLIGGAIFIFYLVSFILGLVYYLGFVNYNRKGLAVLTAAGAAVLLCGLLVSVDSSLSVLRLCCHLVVFCPYCVSTGLMLSICCSRKTGNKPAVSMEMTQRVGVSDKLDGDYDDITADVTTEHAF